MSAQQFLRTAQDGLQEYRVSNYGWIKSPSYMPEIRSGEDLEALLLHLDALDDDNPVIVPGFRFENIHTQPKFGQYAHRKRRLLREHPLVFYEPPELFRYAMPDRVVTYALQGSRSKRMDFNEKLRAGDIGGAIEELPQFFQPFVSRQRASLLRSDEDAPDPEDLDIENGKIEDGWGDQRADKGYADYYRGVVQNAKQVGHAHVVAPVPAITKSSRDTHIRRMRGSNRAMLDICDAAHFGFSSPVLPYYHVYADYNILRTDNDNEAAIIDALERDLQTTGSSDIGFAGIVLTLSGYEKAWDNKLDGQLEQFVSRLADIGSRFGVPLILPRSEWYGMHLSDHGAQVFSSMMNGHKRYKQKGGGMGGDDRHYLFGYTPLYDHAVELTIDSYEQALSNMGGSAHPIDGLPDSPPTYNPKGDTYKQKFGSPREYRINFGKARRLLHVQEARELRDGIRNGLMSPARRYLDRSQHDHLNR